MKQSGIHLPFMPLGCIPLERVLANCVASNKRCLPAAQGCGPLALVGGGPSAAKHIDELRAWPGEVWAINGAAGWCIERGINATLVTMHPDIEVPACVTRAVLGEECSPDLFEKLSGRELYILTDRTRAGSTLPRGGTTATAVAIAAPLLGFADTTFFGCEGSYGGTSHNYAVYQDPNEPWMIVRVGSETFRTKAEFLLQSYILAELVHAFPIYEERSGGLLAALVRNNQYEVIDQWQAA